jgi:hypothetical protein
MRKSSFCFAWAFVSIVAAYDVYFAWQYRAEFQVWEINPLARWMAHLFGLWTVFGAKALLLGFATSVAVQCYRCRHRLTLPYTMVVGGIHLGLSLQYLLGHIRLI